jgi:hypothetical protein
MYISDGADGASGIPAAPRAAGAPAPASSSPMGSANDSPVPPPFKAYVPQPTAPPVTPVVATPSNVHQYYAHAPPPTFTRPPTTNTDPRAQDAVELCNFAILSLKVLHGGPFRSFALLLVLILYLRFVTPEK